MKMLISENAGFCYGVKKAISIAETSAKKFPKPIYTIGPLIHNKYEVNRLAKLGTKPVSTINKLNRGTVIIRTHGLPKKIVSKLAGKKNIRLIDATCPFVKRVQHLVEKLSKDGCSIIIIGEKNHPETIALVSYSSGSEKVAVIDSVQEIKTISFNENKPVAIVSQTTQSRQKFNRIVSIIKKKYLQLKVFNTICNASSDRQEEAEKLAKRVDRMLVIGGKNSGNTTRLKDICSKYVKTYHIECEKEIKSKWFKGAETVGITAGASTPDWIIKGVIRYCKTKQ